MSEARNVRWFEELTGEDYPRVGKKIANLGEMLKAGMRVTPGFGITTEANARYLAETGIGDEISALCSRNGSLSGEALAGLSPQIVRRVETSAMPIDLETEIRSGYEELSMQARVRHLPVAVRSSGTVSMPGQMETYLNIRGADDLLRYVRRCWASAYSPEALTYRAENGLELAFPIGVGVQKMVHSVTAGVMFTLNPVNGDRSKIYIEASWGLGEAVVSGLVNPDVYLIDKVTLEVLKRLPGDKGMKYVYSEEGSDIVPQFLEGPERHALCLSDTEVLELARLGQRIETYYGKAYDIEFGIDADFTFPENVFVLQVRPESVWNKRTRESVLQHEGNAVAQITSVWRNLRA